MPDVVLSNDDLTVLAGPPTIELLVDIGPTGTRGSKFFVGIGNPNSLSGLGQIPVSYTHLTLPTKRIV